MNVLARAHNQHIRALLARRASTGMPAWQRERFYVTQRVGTQLGRPEHASVTRVCESASDAHAAAIELLEDLAATWEARWREAMIRQDADIINSIAVYARSKAAELKAAGRLTDRSWEILTEHNRVQALSERELDEQARTAALAAVLAGDTTLLRADTEDPRDRRLREHLQPGAGRARRPAVLTGPLTPSPANADRHP